jgi:hypothetical protein
MPLRAAAQWGLRRRLRERGARRVRGRPCPAAPPQSSKLGRCLRITEHVGTLANHGRMGPSPSKTSPRLSTATHVVCGGPAPAHLDPQEFDGSRAPRILELCFIPIRLLMGLLINLRAVITLNPMHGLKKSVQDSTTCSCFVSW